jgi:photosystem II stability/assembly factor-like uncharacterized protein
VATAPNVSSRSIYRTLNGGNSWASITGNLPDRYPADLWVDATTDARVFITFSGYGTSHVFKSTDFGSTWMDISNGLPDLPTSAVISDPLYPDHIYIGNDLGVFVSTDDGNTWVDFSQGLPEAVMVFDLSISPLNRKLRVATHGNGAYERDLIEQPVSIASSGQQAETFQLHQNYPNPFNPTTTIRYTMTEPGPVTLKIYNMLGQEIKTLLESHYHGAGSFNIQWDGRNNAGQRVASGIYVYRLTLGEQSITRYMTFSK